MDEEWVFPFLLGTGFGSCISPVPEGEEEPKKPRIGFHTPERKVKKKNGRRTSKSNR